MSKIMYVCEICSDEYPEGCGHYDRMDLAVMPDGTWLCEGCAAEFDNMADCGVTPAGTIDDPQWPKFSDFPCPPEYQPK